MQIPRFLHRVATIALILLAIVHLHTRTRSFILTGAILAMASTGLILEKAPIPSRRPPSSSSSSSIEEVKTASSYPLALSLFRATLYAFVGDAAAAQLLLTPTTNGEAFELANDEFVQIGLAGLMWTLGGLLWIVEPLIYWLNHRQQNAISNGDTSRLEGGYDMVPQDEEEEEEETIIIWEEEDFELPVHAEKF